MVAPQSLLYPLNSLSIQDLIVIDEQGASDKERMCHLILMNFLINSPCPFACSLDFPGGSDGKASAYNAGGLGSIPGLGRSPGEGNGNPLQYSYLENPMDGGTW